MIVERIEVPEHAFVGAPHRTLISLSVPVLFSLIAEPLTALVDTAFVARLGATSLAALGVGATILASIFWIFNFMGIGGQTAVAQAMGRGNRQEIAGLNTLAFLFAGIAGVGLMIVGTVVTPTAVALMGATGELSKQAASYMYLRWLGAPAVLVALTAFGLLRGLMDMRTPLWVALGINVLNIGLDPLLIFGLGPVPTLGVKGAALASTISQWIGAVWVFLVVSRRLGLTKKLPPGEARRLLGVGGDLFVRTGLLNLFIILATRAATLGGAESGGAHQAIRQFWVFTALLLDAFAISAQSLVGYFLGNGSVQQARRVARVALAWSVWVGILLGVVMLIGQNLVMALLVPASSAAAFLPAWRVCAIGQPLNAVSFATDGIHWGSGDFRFLRNAVIGATVVSLIGLSVIDPANPSALTWVWVVTTIWITFRGLLGVLRVWPGIGKAPLTLHR